MDSLNCWIDRAGNVRAVASSRHAPEKKKGDCIRVSTPERRRTWLGIETVGKTTPDAKAAAKRIIREARRQGFDIIASIDGRTVECFQHDRPTELNRMLS